MAREIEMKKLSPVLFADDLDACVGFWKRLGFEKTVEVPGDDGKPGFAIVARGKVEVMYQTPASVRKDMPGLGLEGTRALLYVEVDDLDAVIAQLTGAPVVVERRTTFYGADELGVREPSGSVVVFSRHGAG